MRKKYIFGKKLYISVLTSILVLLTTVATTFAWVGVFANSTFESFDVIIKASGLDEYGIVISSSGEEGTFGDSIPSIEIKRQIVKNWGYNPDRYDDNSIEAIFSTYNLHQCTNIPVIENNQLKRLGEFKTIEQINTKHYFKFDIYLSATKYYEKSNGSDFLLDAYLKNTIFEGTPKSFILDGDLQYPQTFINPLTNIPNKYKAITNETVISNVVLNSASAARVAFEKFSVHNIGDISSYDAETPKSAIIYSGDTYNYPTYDTESETYEFGGILPNDENFAIMYYNKYDKRYSTNGIKSVSIPQQVLNTRGVDSITGDKILSNSTNHLINSTNNNEKITLGQMIKVRVYFWIEGWDSDCFNAINNSPIKLNIQFGASNEINLS